MRGNSRINAAAMQMTDQLTHVARAFCEARGLSLARVSTLVFNDGKKLDAVAFKGADLATGKFEYAMGWFSNNWPEGAVWPAGIDRPPHSEGKNPHDAIQDRRHG
jgi:hypothetical protein